MSKRETLGERVIALCDDERPEVRAAAAQVLALVGQGEREVVGALVRRLGDPAAAVQRHALEGLSRMGTPVDAAPLLLLASSRDEEVRTRAQGLLGRAGADEEATLVAALSGGETGVRKVAATQLARIGSAAAVDALLGVLDDGEIGEHALQHLRAELDHAEGGKLRKLLRKRLDTRVEKLAAKMTTADTGGFDVKKLCALLRLEGYLAEPASLERLAGFAGPAHGLPVRLAAVAAMRRALGNEALRRSSGAVLSALVTYAAEPEPLARTAVDTLRVVELPDDLVGKLATSPSADARRLAVERMGTQAAGTETLLGALAGQDAGPRDAAARQLAALPGAAGPLVEALLDTKDEALAHRIATLLRAHRGRVPEPALDRLCKRAAAALDREKNGLPTIYGEALGALAPELYAELTFERAKKLGKAGKLADAISLLRPLLHQGAKLTDEQRLLLASLGVRHLGKDLLRAARTVDPFLSQLVHLVGTGYAVSKALLKDRSLELEDLFTIGFNFVESKDDDEKELGAELLSAIVERQPRGKLATAARNKLRLAGELD